MQGAATHDSMVLLNMHFRSFLDKSWESCRSYHATFWLRSSSCVNQLNHFWKLVHKRRKVVRILGHFFHIVIGLSLL
jgi:hypothetical protein